MAQDSSRIQWESETGAINLTGEGKEGRVFTISRDFVEEFKEEMIKTAGKSTFKMIIRKLLEKLGETPGENLESDWEAFEKYNDEQILPVSTEGLNLPKEYKAWDGKTRNLILLPDIGMIMWTVKSFQAFKEVMADIMTEKGANALLNSVGKKAGMAIGPQFIKYFGWSDLQNATDTIDGIAQGMNPVAGWSKGSASTQKGKDGKEMILLNSLNSYEAHEKTSSKPICIITSSLINGIWNIFAETLGSQSAEAREVKCTAKGDDCCTFAVKFKEKGAPPLDWKALEAEWQAI